MYYSQEVIDEVLNGVDIVDVVSAHVHLQKKGAGYMGLCPFHNEKTPSFSVSSQRQTFHSFGCGVGGNAITFLMKYDNMGFQEALKQLADKAGVRLPEANYSKDVKERAQKREQLLAVNKDTATYYYRLLRSPRGSTGMKYLTGRALSPETMKKFGLGYADGRSSDLTSYLKEKGYDDSLLIEAGVCLFDEKRGLHDRFFNRVMFPIQDANSRVIGFGGRVMGDGKPKYLNTNDTPVFDKSRNLYGLNLAKRSRTGSFIICEGYMDVIAMHQAGFSQAIASLGTAFTPGQAALIRRYVKDVILSYDSDDAGVRAALRNIEILREAGLGAKVLDLRPYKDPDEFIKALGPGEFQKRIDGAENSFFYEIRMMKSSYQLEDPGERTRFQQEIARKLMVFENPAERENYLQDICRIHMIDPGIMRQLVGSYNKVSSGSSAAAAREQQQLARQRRQQARQDRSLTRQQKASLDKQKLLLTWLTDDPGLYRQIREYISPDSFSEGICRETAVRLWQRLEDGQTDPGRLASAVIASFETEEDQQAAAALLERRIPGIESPGEREKAFRELLEAVYNDSLGRLYDRSLTDPDALRRFTEGRQKQQKLKQLKLRLKST